MSSQKSVHSIRLLGPWNLTVTDNQLSNELPGPFRCSPPHDWGQELGVTFRGTVCYERKFNCPSNLSSDQKVSLHVGGVDYRAELFLNDEPVGTMLFGESKAFEVRPLLQAFNILRICVTLPSGLESTERRDRQHLAGGLIGMVRLDIHQSES